jgi:hypothetical protein
MKITHFSLVVIIAALLGGLAASSSAEDSAARGQTAVFLTNQFAVANAPVEPVPGPATLTAWAAGIGFFVLLLSRPSKP